MKILISEIEYPIFFGMTAIEKTMISLNCESFEAMGDKLKSNLGMFQLHREVAFNGILAGCKKEGVVLPWKDSEEFGNSIESFEQLTPAVSYFWEVFGGFFKTTGETKPQKVSKATKQNP
jgi:hypothetical protein